MSSISQDTQNSPFNTQDKCCKVIVTNNPKIFAWDNCITDKSYWTLNFWIKAVANSTVTLTIANTQPTTINVTTGWQRVIATVKITELDITSIYIDLPVGTYYFYNSKLEKGNRYSDYSTSDDDFKIEIATVKEISDKKTTCYYSNVEPTGTDFKVGDTWFNGAEDNAVYGWNGSDWVKKAMGNEAIANLDAGKITTGTLLAGRIGAGSITTDKIATSAITADLIASKTITADKLVLNSITSAQIASKTITANQIASNTITAAELNVATLSAISANIGTITAGVIQSSNYVEGSVGMKCDFNTGTLFSTEGHIAGFSFTENGFTCTATETMGPYTEADLQYVADNLETNHLWTEEEFDKYDANGDGVIDIMDIVRMRRIMIGTSTGVLSATYKIATDSTRKMIQMVNIGNTTDDSDNGTYIGAGYIRTKNLLPDLISMKASYSDVEYNTVNIQPYNLVMQHLRYDSGASNISTAALYTLPGVGKLSLTGESNNFNISASTNETTISGDKNIHFSKQPYLNKGFIALYDFGDDSQGGVSWSGEDLVTVKNWFISQGVLT